jgi:iron(III) transport system substrate-binding protein
MTRRLTSAFKILVLAPALLLVAMLVSGCGTGGREEVVVYCAQDQVYAAPLLEAFSKETRIRVRQVYDSEAVKTVGLAQRLLAERANPQCDVFWGNEELRTRQLARAGLFREQNGWAAFGQRSRRIVINTNLLTFDRSPRSLLDLTNAAWRGRVALAYPLFGTTATHFLVLRQRWGADAWERWCRALLANQPLIVDGNSVVVRLVGRGEAAVGLTDSDDIAVGVREDLPVAALPLGPESLLIPNTAGLIRNAPHAHNGATLFSWLQRPETIRALVRAQALEAPAPGEPVPPAPNWDAVLDELQVGIATMEKIFLRK